MRFRNGALQDAAEDVSRMSLGDHLRELRRRVVWACGGILVGAAAGWFFYTPLLEQMIAPLEVVAAHGRTANLNFSTVGSAFDLKIQVSLFLGVFLSSPWWIGQVWWFAAPGLTRKEKVYSVGFIAAAAVLFAIGGGLAWFVLPHAVDMLTAFTPGSAVNFIEARPYFTFFMRVVLAFGVAFLVPLLMVGLNLAGLVRARTYLKAWRGSVLGVLVFTAFANPLPDAWSMLAMAAPMCALYFGAVAVSYAHDRWVDRRRETDTLASAALEVVGRERQSPNSSSL